MIVIGPILIVVNNWPEKDKPASPLAFHEDITPPARDPNGIYRDCADCGWCGGPYLNEGKANMGLGSHRQWCKRGHGQFKSFW